MKQKTIDIPIYECSLTIIIDKNFDYALKKYNLTGNYDNYGALTFGNNSNHKHYVVVFTDANHLSTIVHEIVHIKNHIFIDIGATLDLDNDEPEAYLSGWLFDQIYNFLVTYKSD